jgi:hypothetical protein
MGVLRAAGSPQCIGPRARHSCRLSGNDLHPLSKLATFDAGDGRGSELYAGGNFSSAGGILSSRIVRFEDCAAMRRRSARTPSA